MRHRLFVAVALLSFASVVTACPLDPAKVPQCTGEESWPDPCAAAKGPTYGSPESAPAQCTAACTGLRRADCPEGFPTPGGVTCLAVCERSSSVRAWPLRCWAAAQTRSEVLACGPQLRCAARN